MENEEIEFNEELYKKNIEENDFSHWIEEDARGDVNDNN